MSAAAHDRHRDDVGVYLLGALDEDETRAFEAHLETCHVCLDELKRLQVAADALPHGAPQFEPPPGVKAEVMAVVVAEAGAPDRRERRRPFRAVQRWRPRVAAAVAAAVVAVAVASGLGISQLLSEDEAARTLTATIDEKRLGDADASAKLTVDDDGRDGATLRVAGFPQLRPDRTYMAWVARGKTMAPQPTFEVDASGDGAVDLPADLRGVDAVLVTREPRRGSPAPTSPPLMRVDL